MNFPQTIKILLRSIPSRTLSPFSVLMQSVPLSGFCPEFSCSGLSSCRCVGCQWTARVTGWQENTSIFPAILRCHLFAGYSTKTHPVPSNSLPQNSPIGEKLSQTLHILTYRILAMEGMLRDRCVNPAQADLSQHTHQLHAPVWCPLWTLDFIFFYLPDCFHQLLSSVCRIAAELELKCWLVSLIVSPHPLGHQHGKPSNSFPAAVILGIFITKVAAGCFPQTGLLPPAEIKVLPVL